MVQMAIAIDRSDRGEVGVLVEGKKNLSGRQEKEQPSR